MSLERALELAAAAAGRGYPNPTVGAVVVRPDGSIVGEGVSEPAGGPHAEATALDAAGEAARDGTLFVTMEPCAHHGRTPPCVDRIVASGVARVVAGCADPNPRAEGGAQRLRAAGVDVELLDLPEARRQNEAWRTWVALGRPYVILKLASTVDGRVAVPGAVDTDPVLSDLLCAGEPTVVLEWSHRNDSHVRFPPEHVNRVLH